MNPSGSINITLSISILYYYSLLLLAPLFYHLTLYAAVPTLAIIFWLHISLFINCIHFRTFIAQTIIMTLLTLVLILTARKKVTFNNLILLLVHHPASRPMALVIWVVLPAIFFSSNYDPFLLVKDLAMFKIPTTGYLLVIFTFGETFKRRFLEISEVLTVRGINLSNSRERITNINRFLPQLLRGMIEQAGYRGDYSSMLGCPPGRLPSIHSKNTISPLQILFGSAGLLFILIAIIFRVH